MVNRPLVVDLDGTLIHTDMLHESVLELIKQNLFYLFILPYWLFKGKAALKRWLASKTKIDVTLLPYNQSFLDWLMEEKERGRSLVLCTASDSLIANSIAVHLNIFDEVIASNGINNLAGHGKSEALERRFGGGNFDYAGNSNADLAVWKSAHSSIIVNASKSLENKAKSLFNVEKKFPQARPSLSTIIRMLRVHQWMKNLLLFVPLITAHQVGHLDSWLVLLSAFVSFSLCASVVYIANDLLDLESDRLHPRKRKRPFASGLIPIWLGVLLAPILLLISFIIGAFVGQAFLICLGIYFLLTCAYSSLLKRLVLVDCLTLAMLYTIRVIAGSLTLAQYQSFWLLAFSVFIFLSLAFVKRYAELEIQQLSGYVKVHGRGYHTSDAPIIQSMGVVAGYTAALVLALYLNSDEVAMLYQLPQVIWAAIPVILFWISWMWMQAHRGKMHDDPLVYAAKDPVSLISGVLLALIMLLGAKGLPVWIT